MVVVTNVCELTDGFLWFVCGLYVGILTSPPKRHIVIIRTWVLIPPLAETKKGHWETPQNLTQWSNRI